MLIAVALLIVPQSTFAAGKRALVIGNSAYPKHKLATPVNDARLIARRLQKIGFDVTQVLNADAKELQSAIKAFERKSKSASLSLVYFAGLVVQLDKRNYLLPLGIDLRSAAALKRFGIPASRFAAKRASGARILILDPSAPPSRFNASGLKPMKPGTNQLIAFGVSPGKWPKGVPGSNGFFARALAKHIGRPGIDAKQVVRQTTQTVLRDSRQAQQPWSASTLRHRVPLSSAPPAAVARSSRPAATTTSRASRGGTSLSHDRTAEAQKQTPAASEARKRQRESSRRTERQKQVLARPGSEKSQRASAQQRAAREAARKRAERERSQHSLARLKAARPATAAAAKSAKPAASAKGKSTFSSPIKGLSTGGNFGAALKGKSGTNIKGNVAVLSKNSNVRLGSAVAITKQKPKRTDVTRFPTIESPDEVPVGQNFAVQVSLTVDEITPEVKIKPSKGTKVTKEGALSLPLPAGDEWEIDVILSAPGFKLASGQNTQKITLPRDDDSTPALFTLAARPIKTATKARKIYATLWHKGAYLAKVIKPISIVNETATAPPPGRSDKDSPGASAQQSQPTFTLISAPSQAKPAPIAVTAEPPQLTVYILHGAKGEDGPAGQIIINSPYLQPAVAPYRAPDDMADWLTSQYDRLLTELTARTSLPLAERTVPMMRGFGQLVYKYFAPDAFKSAFWKLKDKLGSRFTSIQIYSNNPLIPWELMRPRSKDGKTQLDFLGIEYKVARWHIGENTTQLDKPPQRLLLKELVTIAPRYKGKDILPNQAQEMSVLAKLPGHRAMSGKLSAMRKLFTELPSGIVHFSGHGVIGTDDTPKYAIRLEDIELDVVSWRGLAPPAPKNHPFIFLNACDIGQSRRVANFVDGWAPAVLETGAGGYIGGLWPLSDTAAAGFSNAFYTRLYAKLKDGDVKAAEVLQFARRDFLKTGDPTYLAYAYYGDVNLRFVTR